MGDEEKKDPPPPSLSKPSPTPPPPSLSKAKPAPQMAMPEGGSGPPVIQAKPKIVDSGEAEEDELEHGAIAPLNPRLISAAIDGLTAIGLYFGAVLIFPGFLDRLAGLLPLAYMITRDSLPFLKGQGIGKTSMKLKAVKQDGTGLVSDWQSAIVRNILFVIPFFGPLIEAIVLFTRDDKPERGRRLGDDWAKTKVVVWRPDESSAEEAEKESK